MSNHTFEKDYDLIMNSNTAKISKSCTSLTRLGHILEEIIVFEIGDLATFTTFFVISVNVNKKVYNPGQNIWNKIEKSSKTGQERKSLISTFECFFD